MPDVKNYIIDRVTIVRERFELQAISPAAAQEGFTKRGMGNPLSSTTETEVQVSLASEAGKPGKRASGKKGTRIPADWQPDRAYAASKGMYETEIDREAEKFRNYWSAKAGTAATKLDWARTWYTWVLTFCERAGRIPPPPTATPSAVFSDAQWMKALNLYWSSGRWHRDYGPEPGRPGCKVPVHLLPQEIRREETKALPSPDLFVR